MESDLASQPRDLEYRKRRIMKGLGISRSLRPSTPKERLLNAVRRLPKNATVADVLDLAYFLAKIDEALTEFEEGRLVPKDEIEKMLLERAYGKHDN